MKSGVNTILTITGSDGMGSSGVQADIKTISALGGYSVSAITSITVQNSIGIQEFFDLPAETVAGQIEALINDVQPAVVKIGMIRSVEVLKVLSEMLSKYDVRHVIYDPIVYSSRGDELMSRDVIAQIKNRLLPFCTLVVVRKTDAEYILDTTITNEHDRHIATDSFKAYGCNDVLLIDESFHGQSNNISSAIATFLGKGQEPTEAITNALQFTRQQNNELRDIPGRSRELYGEFIDSIALHYHTNGDVRFYADCLNVSSRYLAQVTKRIAGKTPKTIIEDYIIAELERQLSSTDKTIQEIAYEHGFSSQAHLSKFFKKKIGITPTAYRHTAKSVPNLLRHKAFQRTSYLQTLFFTHWPLYVRIPSKNSVQFPVSESLRRTNTVPNS